MVVVFRDRPVGRACTTLVAGVAAFSLAFGGTAANAEEPAGEGVALEAVLSDVAPEVLGDIANAEEGDGVVSYVEDGVTAELPLDPEGEIALGSDVGEISLGFPFADQATPLETSDAGTVAFDNGNSSSSFAAIRGDGSVQVNTVIDSKNAPTRYGYPVELPDGATLSALDDGRILMSDAEGGDLGLMEAPWAKDASGRDVPTRYEIEGRTVTQVVDHSAEYRYPVVADPVVIVTKYEYKYINVKQAKNWTNKGQQLGVCKIEKGAGGGTCKISAKYTSQTEISTSFGVAKWIVAANLGISYSKTEEGSVSWTSPSAPVGSVYKAWAIGTRTTYNIQQWKVTGPAGLSVGQKRKLNNTSGQLASFTPVRGFSVGQ